MNYLSSTTMQCWLQTIPLIQISYSTVALRCRKLRYESFLYSFVTAIEAERHSKVHLISHYSYSSSSVVLL
jgi:hypothetical protein